MDDDLNISTLKSIVENSHVWTGYATLIILFGILLELIVLFIFSHGNSRRERFTLYLATILIALGLAAEYFYGNAGANASAELQRISDEKIAVLSKDTAHLSLETESARAAIAQANARAAEAMQKAKEADLAQSKLEKKISPRLLNVKQGQKIAAALSKFTGLKIDVIVFTAGSTADASSLGNALFKIFADAKWEPKFWTALGDGWVVEGVLVQIKEGAGQETEDASGAIISALNSEHILARSLPAFKTGSSKEVSTASVNGDDPWIPFKVAPIRILIGAKP